MFWEWLFFVLIFCMCLGIFWFLMSIRIIFEIDVLVVGLFIVDKSVIFNILRILFLLYLLISLVFMRCNRCFLLFVLRVLMYVFFICESNMSYWCELIKL